MTKLSTKQPSLLLFPPPQPALEPTRRLLVLVPSVEVDLAPLARRVWALANAARAQVKFLSLCDDSAQEPGLRRRLATVSAMVSSDQVSAQTEIVPGRDWVQAVKSRCQTGDVIVCSNELHGGLWRKPLNQILRADLDVPVFILSGLYPLNDSYPGWLAQAAAWIGSIAIILGFFVLQAAMDDFAKGSATGLQLLSLPVEIWLILAWNSLFG